MPIAGLIPIGMGRASLVPIGMRTVFPIPIVNKTPLFKWFSSGHNGNECFRKHVPWACNGGMRERFACKRLSGAGEGMKADGKSERMQHCRWSCKARNKKGVFI